MTIAEYDAKAGIRKTLAEIDQVLADLEYWPDRNTCADFHFQGIGTIGLFNSSKIANGVNDPVIVKDFRSILLRRKQELINEFMR